VNEVAFAARNIFNQIKGNNLDPRTSRIPLLVKAVGKYFQLSDVSGTAALLLNW